MKIKEKIESNNDKKEEFKRLQKAIDSEEDNKKKLLAQNGSFTEEQLLSSYHNISNWWEKKNEAEKRKVELKPIVDNLTKRIAETQAEYDKLAQNSVASSYCKIHTVFDKIKKAFESAKDRNTKDFLSLLEEKANHYLETLNKEGFYGTIRITSAADGSRAEIKLMDERGNFIAFPNTALKTTMYMSVLFAVSDLTTIKRENDYPLIFDAPTSSFAPDKESDFYNVISSIKKQCIIFTKSFLNEKDALDIDKIEKLKGTVYRIEKKRPFNEKDLSTIQTIITPIK